MKSRNVPNQRNYIKFESKNRFDGLQLRSDKSKTFVIKEFTRARYKYFSRFLGTHFAKRPSSLYMHKYINAFRMSSTWGLFCSRETFSWRLHTMQILIKKLYHLSLWQTLHICTETNLNSNMNTLGELSTMNFI